MTELVAIPHVLVAHFFVAKLIRDKILFTKTVDGHWTNRGVAIATTLGLVELFASVFVLATLLSADLAYSALFALQITGAALYLLIAAIAIAFAHLIYTESPHRFRIPIALAITLTAIAPVITYIVLRYA